MTVRVKDILSTLNIEAPFHLAEPWDNVGLLVGNPNQEVTAILAGLDPTNSLIDEAIDLGANTIITHHPVIFKPLPTLDTSTPEGKLLEKAITNRLAIIGFHTNFDSVPTGVSTVLAELLGLSKLSPLIPTPEKTPAGSGLGRIGSYHPPISAVDFSQRVLNALRLDTVQMVGTLPEKVTTVAVCGGSCSEFAVHAQGLGADVFVSAEIKHNIAIWAIENDFCIIDGTHYGTEKPAVAFLVAMLTKAAHREKWNIKIVETTTERHPFVLINKNNH